MRLSKKSRLGEKKLNDQEDWENEEEDNLQKMMKKNDYYSKNVKEKDENNYFFDNAKEKGNFLSELDNYPARTVDLLREIDKINHNFEDGLNDLHKEGMMEQENDQAQDNNNRRKYDTNLGSQNNLERNKVARKSNAKANDDQGSNKNLNVDINEKKYVLKKNASAGSFAGHYQNKHNASQLKNINFYSYAKSKNLINSTAPTANTIGKEEIMQA